MDVQKVEISLGAFGRGKVAIGGADLAASVTALWFEADGRTLPRLTLELAPGGISDITADHALVRMGEDTHRALLALGWTPPAGDA